MTDKSLYLSPSRISMWQRCPKQYYFRYILGEKQAPGIAAILGTAGHAGIEHNYRHKMETGSGAPVPEVIDAYSDAFDKGCSDIRGDFGGFSDEGEFDEGALKDVGAHLVELHTNKIAPLVDPVAVEDKFWTEMGGSHMLHGVVDVEDKDGTIIDNKFVGKTPGQADVDKSIQLTAYAYSRKDSSDTELVNVRIDAMVKTRVPKLVHIASARHANDFEVFEDIFRGVEALIDAGHFPPNPTGWHCSQRFCGYWDKCMGKKG